MGESRDPEIGDFEGEPTRRLEDWVWLWSTDARLPVRSHRGPLGKLIVAVKRLLGPLARAVQSDLWERQRVFNLILLERLRSLEDRAAETGQRLQHLEELTRQGLEEVMLHNDALFSRVDQKLDRYRRESAGHTATLRAALAAVEAAPADPPAVALSNADAAHRYLEFEERYRGTPEEIERRIARYLPVLEGRSPILDLGCGRGEALALLGAHGLEARGVDDSVEMVRHCRERGLAVERGDAVAALAAVEPASLGAVLALHLVEHLQARELDRLVDLALRTLRPGGLLLLETPSPLSLVAGASRFWTDPSHRRPVHPEALRFRCQSAGFSAVEIQTLHPFADSERLPEIGQEGLSTEDARTIADRMDRFRDRLDDLLYGDQDYALLATK